MKERLIKWLACPKCNDRLQLEVSQYENNEIKAGKLICSNCNELYNIREYIPRFVEDELYSSSFGLEWNVFRLTQHDSYTGAKIFYKQFIDTTCWEMESLKDNLVLDAGCGSGPYTEVVSDAGAEVIAIDISAAVDACFQNHGLKDNVHVIQANIYSLPFRDCIFDKIFSIGVLQHTPDPKKAFLSLPKYLKKNGEIAIWMYKKLPFGFPRPRRFYRILTSRIPSNRLFSFLETYVPAALPISRSLKIIPLLGRYLAKLIPVVDYKGVFPLSEKQLYEFELLDTFDMLSPKYEYPQHFRDVKSWFVLAGLKNIVRCLRAGIAIKGKK